MNILVLAEHDNKILKAVTKNVIQAASELGRVHVIILGFNCKKVAEEVSYLAKVDKVYYLDNPLFENALAETFANFLHDFSKNYTHVLAPSTTFGKNILPRLAALLDVGQISDVIKIIDEKTFVRPIYAGNALATVETSDSFKLLTIRTTAFNPVNHSDDSATIEYLEKKNINPAQSQFVKLEECKSNRPDLTNARVIIAGGRGLQNAENFKMLEDLADKLNAAVGASRAAVDAGYVPNDYQVGQTGKVVAPELYIAVGISGAIQHLAGMKDSKIIVAINKDPEAPIFNSADYGLVGDLFDIIPQLIKAL